MWGLHCQPALTASVKHYWRPGWPTGHIQIACTRGGSLAGQLVGSMSLDADLVLSAPAVCAQRMAEMQRAAQFGHPQQGAVPPPFFQPPPGPR